MIFYQILLLFFFHLCMSDMNPVTFCNSTAFLIGPTHQLQMMLDSDRVYATVIYIGSVIVALFCALLVSSKVCTVATIHILDWP